MTELEKIQRRREEEKLNAWFAQTMKARQTILDHAKEYGNIGAVDCPVCGKVMKYSIASNGHVHAACDTAGCLRWME